MLNDWCSTCSAWHPLGKHLPLFEVISQNELKDYADTPEDVDSAVSLVSATDLEQAVERYGERLECEDAEGYEGGETVCVRTGH